MEIVFLSLLFAAAGVLFLQTLTYTTPTFDTSGGPALFPQYILILLMVSIGVLIIQLVIRKEGRDFVFLELFRSLRGIFLLSIVLYLFALNYFGFYIATAIFLLFTVNYLTFAYTGTVGTWKRVVLRCILLLVIITVVNYLFGDLFNIMLPKGKLL
ncbi:MAG: tripartite tricarboxylate transporter TctB family protein [Spirochaetia bacterium]|nr:tripartite tricarboxylate transporter TctB family protein [Spirochaetia bacterium]